ncbi:serine hydrolase domain-containing protein [Streptomyces sp. DSM 44917]|uniref:Serine hydrolase domain-containing protein n=1 Tax=Streptomyces boetiae TaxID=3075541 RepID=A0ABU2LD54_9ACTN|nr:serine hydrolase domain-containing protein [Streptomyces sp. DSM 44917]MDT0309511.1 serine hydrolase domain-containing protein [Streptomyces sp. DSM 44917]
MTRTRRTRRAGVALAVAAVLAAGCGGEEREREQAPLTDPAVAAVLEELLPQGADGTVAVDRGGELVHCAGFGDPEAGCDTVYDIGSNTKQFTAAAVLRLERQGELNVTDRLSEHLDGRELPPDKREITLHHLLTHTAGLPDSLGDDYDPLTREEMLDGALAAEPIAEPGERFAYSNLGYSVLAAVVEIASGRDYEAYLAEELFAPAGMTSTGYVLPDWDPADVAVEYDPRGEPMGRPYDHPWAEDGPHWNLRGNGGLLSTARDMHRWHRALQGGAVLDAGARERLVEPWAEMPPESEDDPPFAYGYGWMTFTLEDGTPVALHSGGNDWSLSVIARYLDDGSMVFWVTNTAAREGAWNFDDLTRELTLDLGATTR